MPRPNHTTLKSLRSADNERFVLVTVGLAILIANHRFILQSLAVLTDLSVSVAMTLVVCAIVFPDGRARRLVQRIGRSLEDGRAEDVFDRIVSRIDAAQHAAVAQITALSRRTRRS